MISYCLQYARNWPLGKTGSSRKHYQVANGLPVIMPLVMSARTIPLVRDVVADAETFVTQTSNIIYSSTALPPEAPTISRRVRGINQTWINYWTEYTAQNTGLRREQVQIHPMNSQTSHQCPNQATNAAAVNMDQTCPCSRCRQLRTQLCPCHALVTCACPVFCIYACPTCHRTGELKYWR
ncbi:hypothetical protein NQZ79_g1616 [Umbelopsis isabellina]|nr:hypothetical protein NQZ79_g1616 [Umbelopsis isabellina]